MPKRYKVLVTVTGGFGVTVRYHSNFERLRQAKASLVPGTGPGKSWPSDILRLELQDPQHLVKPLYLGRFLEVTVDTGELVSDRSKIKSIELVEALNEIRKEET